MSKILINDIEVLLTVDSQNTVLKEQSIVIENDRISAIGPANKIAQQYRDQNFDKAISGKHRLAMPGMVDAHLHLSEQLGRGLFPDQLSTRPWVFNWAKPLYAAVDPEAEHIGTLLAGIEMIKTGTTCCLDMGTQNDVGKSVKSIEEAGFRCVTGRHAADVIPAQLPPHWTQEMIDHHFFPNYQVALEELGRCVREHNNSADGRVRVWVNIEGKEPCSPELHAGSRALAEKLGVGTTYHIASSIEEAQVCKEKYGVWPVGRLKEIDALGPNLVLAHVVAIQDEEIGYLASAETKVVFCPGTSLKIAKGATKIGQYPEMINAGVTLALGCDGPAASGSLNQMQQMYLMAGLFKDCRMDPFQIPAELALQLVTIEGAKALLWDNDIGSIEVGKKADIVLFNLNTPDWVPYQNPIQTLVYSATPGSVDTVLIDGQLLMENRKILHLDEQEIYKAAREQAGRVIERSGLQPGTTPIHTEAYD